MLQKVQEWAGSGESPEEISRRPEIELYVPGLDAGDAETVVKHLLTHGLGL